MKLEDYQIAAHRQAAAAVPVPDYSELLGEAMALHPQPTILAAPEMQNGPAQKSARKQSEAGR